MELGESFDAAKCGVKVVRLGGGRIDPDADQWVVASLAEDIAGAVVVISLVYP